MSEPKRDILKQNQVADLDPYGKRHAVVDAKDLLREEIIEEAQPEEDLEGIITFTPETKQKLEELGYTILTLHGETRESLKEKGMKESVKSLDITNDSHSRKSQIAVMLNQNGEFGLEGSGNNSRTEQAILVDAYSAKVHYQIDDIVVTPGTAMDYMELAFQNPNMFGGKYVRSYTSLSSFGASAGGDICVGVLDSGIDVILLNSRVGRGEVIIAPLLYPSMEALTS